MIIKPWQACAKVILYVCMSVTVTVTVVAATNLVIMSKGRYELCIYKTLMKMFRLTNKTLVTSLCVNAEIISVDS